MSDVLGARARGDRKSFATSLVDRRTIIATGAAGILLATATSSRVKGTIMTDPAPTVTVERRDHVLLIGINRPSAENRVDPPTFALLGKAFHDYEHDASLRAAVLFGHGPNFCAGLDVTAFAPVIAEGKFNPNAPGTINPLQIAQPRLSKPRVCVVHGNTFFMGHELMLASDVRVAAQDTVFSQSEAHRAVFAGGGATVRFPREAGWGQAMRYLLTGDTWSADEARKMSLVSEIAPTPAEALALGIELAAKIARAAPLSIKATLASAHQAVTGGEEQAFAALAPTFAELTKAQDFQERVRSLSEGRQPVYQGK